MNIKTGQQSPYLLLGLFFAAVALVALVALLVVTSRADSSSQTATVTNTIPTVDNTTIATSAGGSLAASITLTESSKTVYIHGEASDMNGCQHIDTVTGGGGSSWNVKFYRTNVTNGAACSANPLNCYDIAEVNANVTGCAGPTDTSLDYDFTTDVYFNADATDPGSNPDNAGTTWTASVCVADDDGGTSSPCGLQTTEINTLNSLNINSPVAFGSLALNAISPDATMTVTNQGNFNAMKVKIQQQAQWSCDLLGSIPIGRINFSTTNDFVYGNASSITGVAGTVTGLVITKQATTGNPSTGTIYTKLRAPVSGARGSCTAILDFTATS